MDEVSLTGGAFMPWGNIPGVKDTYSMWGFSYYHPSSIWNMEYQYHGARGQGVIYHVISAGIRVDFIIEQMLEVFLTGGLDLHYYKRAPSEFGDRYNYNSTAGIHLGFGGFFAITDRFKLRSELKFHNGPGKSIYVGLGPTLLF